LRDGLLPLGSTSEFLPFAYELPAAGVRVQHAAFVPRSRRAPQLQQLHQHHEKTNDPSSDHHELQQQFKSTQYKLQCNQYTMQPPCLSVQQQQQQRWQRAAEALFAAIIMTESIQQQTKRPLTCFHFCNRLLLWQKTFSAFSGRHHQLGCLFF
jgi:hypothetical protein